MEQLHRNATLDVRQRRKMGSTEQHRRRVLEVRGPYGIRTTRLSCLPAQAAISLICLGDKRLEEVPRHPLVSEKTRLGLGLLQMGVDKALSEVVCAHSMIDIVIGELPRNVMRGRSQGEI